MNHLLAVYGTLKRGAPDHYLLGGATFMGNQWLSELTLFDLGDGPVAVRQHSLGGKVEVYSVPSVALDTLDDMLPGVFYRETVMTRHGPTWMYFYRGSVADFPQINNGVWCPPAPEKTA